MRQLIDKNGSVMAQVIKETGSIMLRIGAGSVQAQGNGALAVSDFAISSGPSTELFSDILRKGTWRIREAMARNANAVSLIFCDWAPDY